MTECRPILPTMTNLIQYNVIFYSSPPIVYNINNL